MQMPQCEMKSNHLFRASLILLHITVNCAIAFSVLTFLKYVINAIEYKVLCHIMKMAAN